MRFLIILFPLVVSAQVLNITILDYASVPPKTLEAALGVFGHIYGNAGGRVEWTVQPKAWRPSESIRLEDVPGDIVLRICNKEMAKRLVRKASTIGYVQPVAERQLRRVATVFYHRVQELKDFPGNSIANLLGAALAHELGHLLLGKGSHSPAGIMRCPWDTEELRAINRGQLFFDAQQSALLAKSIVARTTGVRDSQ